MHPVRQQHQHPTAITIDDQRRAREPGVADHPRATHHAHRRDVGDPQPKALTEARLEPIRQLVAHHLLDRRRLQDARPVEGTTLAQRFAQTRQLRRRAEHACVTHCATQGPGVLVVDTALDHAPSDVRLVLRGSDTREHRRRREEASVGQIEGDTHSFADQGGQGSSSDRLREVARDDVADVGVAERGARRAFQWGRKDGRPPGGDVGPSSPQVEECRQTRGVAQQVPERDRPTDAAGERLQMGMDGPVQGELARVDQAQ